MTNYYGKDPFGSMDDIFNQLMGNTGGYQTENRRYLVNGREMTPEEFQEQTIAKNGILYFNQNYANEAIGSSHTMNSGSRARARAMPIRCRCPPESS